MVFLLASVLLFGLVHPLSRLILDQGIPLSFFCVAYVGIRLLVQLPVLTWKGGLAIRTGKVLLALGALGGAGALLQLFEFLGIERGLPPATVTFLVFSYPIWILAISLATAPRALRGVDAFQAAAAVTGIFLVSRAGGVSPGTLSRAMVYPLLASVFIALWIVLSNRLRKAGVAALTLSVYYDLFSLIALVAIFGSGLARDWPRFLEWSRIGSHPGEMILYSIFVGLLPNYLFYHGSRAVGSLCAGTVLALEPILSAGYSAAIWPVEFGGSFVAGGACILLANLPEGLRATLLRRFGLNIGGCPTRPCRGAPASTHASNSESEVMV